jgi:hypothetical protein
MRSIFSLLSIFTIIITLCLITLGQDQAGDVQADGGSKITRIGLLLPKVNLVEAEGEVDPAEALRSSYAIMINSDLFEVVALESKITSLALDEANKLNCDYILKVDLDQEQKKKSGGLFGGIADRVARDTGRRTTRETARRIPYGGGTGEQIARTTAQSAIINTGYSMANMKVKVKKNDKFILDYNLTTAKGQSFYSNKIEAKAKGNNDDTLMKIIEQSANDMVITLKKKLPQ